PEDSLMARPPSGFFILAGVSFHGVTVQVQLGFGNRPCLLALCAGEVGVPCKCGSRPLRVLEVGFRPHGTLLVRKTERWGRAAERRRPASHSLPWRQPPGGIAPNRIFLRNTAPTRINWSAALVARREGSEAGERRLDRRPARISGPSR